MFDTSLKYSKYNAVLIAYHFLRSWLQDSYCAQLSQSVSSDHHPNVILGRRPEWDDTSKESIMQAALNMVTYGWVGDESVQAEMRPVQVQHRKPLATSSTQI